MFCCPDVPGIKAPDLHRFLAASLLNNRPSLCCGSWILLYLTLIGPLCLVGLPIGLFSLSWYVFSLILDIFLINSVAGFCISLHSNWNPLFWNGVTVVWIFFHLPFNYTLFLFFCWIYQASCLLFFTFVNLEVLLFIFILLVIIIFKLYLYFFC